MGANLSDLMRAIQGLRDMPRFPVGVIALVTDDERLPAPASAAAMLPAGSLVIARSRDDGRLKELATTLRPVCRQRGLVLLVSGDARLAHALGADGVHLPEAALKIRPRRPWPERPGWLVTAAAHDSTAIRRAERAGVDAVLVSPVFATASHPAVRPLGPLRFAALCRATKLPALALGGIDTETARRLRQSGAAGIAGIGFATASVSGAEPAVGI